jgi:hypothetical protein
MTILLGLFFINIFFLGQYPFLQMSVAIILLAAMIIFLLMGVFYLIDAQGVLLGGHQ